MLYLNAISSDVDLLYLNRLQCCFSTAQSLHILHPSNGRDERGLTVCHLLSGSAGGEEMTEETRSNVNGGHPTEPIYCTSVVPWTFTRAFTEKAKPHNAARSS